MESRLKSTSHLTLPPSYTLDHYLHYHSVILGIKSLKFTHYWGDSWIKIGMSGRDILRTVPKRVVPSLLRAHLYDGLVGELHVVSILNV